MEQDFPHKQMLLIIHCLGLLDDYLQIEEAVTFTRNHEVSKFSPEFSL